MGYMWKGRFEGDVNKKTMDFTSSIDIDCRLAHYDIKGSIAHAQMLAKCNIIKAGESKKIIAALKSIEKEIEEGRLVFHETDEDIHTAIERRLIELTGKPGEKLHTARSRNDQIVLDEKLYIRDEISIFIDEIVLLQRSFLQKSMDVYPRIIPSYTHLQQSQPVLISHYLLAYIEMLERDKQRLKDTLKRVDIFPAGVCACAGTSLPVDREYMAGLLGFSEISANSIDTVSDRDFLVEFVSNAVMLMVHLSRFSEDIIIWNTEEYKFVNLPDEFCTGSSIMPQKKNPDVLELVRGKTASAIGSLAGLLALMKGLPLSYNRDLQEDKEPMFKIVDSLHLALNLLADMVAGMDFIQENIDKKSSEMLITTDIAEYLVGKGVPFRQAHGICGGLVRYCLDSGKTFSQLTPDQWKGFSGYFSEDIQSRIDMKCSVDSKKSAGGTAPMRVQKEIDKWQKLLK